MQPQHPPSLPPTPAEAGYRMPAEWEPHEATWTAWPYDPVTFPNRVEAVEEAFLQILAALTPHERVELVVKDTAMRDRVAARLLDAKIGNTKLHVLDHVDVWARDWGPTFVVRDHAGRRQLGAVKWEFNAWGDKYEDLKRDNGLALKILPRMGIPIWKPGVVMEGGSFDVNGSGTVLTTEQCLLNQNRNPGVSRQRIDEILQAHVGARKVLWLGDGVTGDDTDGHVDDIARFVGPRTIVCASQADEADPDHAPLKESRDRLRGMTDQDGRPFRVVELPMPEPVGDDEGRLPASYANFLIANRVVLMPSFGQATDEAAANVIAACFPDRRIVRIPCQDLLHGMGTIHCVTQQQPATGRLSRG